MNKAKELITTTDLVRMILKQHPELAGNDVVEGHRSLNEEVYRDYARQVLV